MGSSPSDSCPTPGISWSSHIDYVERDLGDDLGRTVRVVTD
jgi:hypothetical protein